MTQFKPAQPSRRLQASPGRAWLGVVLVAAFTSGCMASPTPTASWVKASKTALKAAARSSDKVMTIKAPKEFRGTGALALAFRFPQADYTLQSAGVARVSKLVVRLKTRTFLVLKQVAEAQVSRQDAQDGQARVSFDALKAGAYTVEVQAFDAQGVTIGATEQEVLVRAGQTSKVQTRLKLKAAAGAAPAPAPADEGNLALEVVIEEENAPSTPVTPSKPLGPDSSVAGAVSTPYPTINNLSVEWAVAGDKNMDGRVSVRFREAGSSTWRQGMNLIHVPAGSNKRGFSWAHRHSGSLFDLKADTTYEIELTLNDADGGGTVRTVTARTRAVPAPMAGAPVRMATPSTFKAVAAKAQPGDIIELSSGTYGGFTFGRNGTPGRPIVIRSRAGAVVDGNIDLSGREHVHLEGLTIKGRVRFNNSRNLAILRNRVTITGKLDAIASRLRSENAYIADNVVIGPTPWAEASLGVHGKNGGEGIVVTGPGHVIQNNRIKGFRDNISLMEGDEAVDQFSIDIVGNDIEVGADDGIEADYGFHNVRVINNRIRNSFIGISSQPSLGGPTYMIRNVMYNVLFMGFKLHNESIGNYIAHNTVVKNGDAFGVYSSVPFSHTTVINNLLIGGPSAGSFGGYSTGRGRVLSVQALDLASFSLKHNALGSTTGAFSGRLGDVSFRSLAEMERKVGARNSLAVGLDAFASGVPFPSSPMTEYAMPDMRLQAGTAPVDSAAYIPNLNDGFVGAAPDRGALEAGRALPHYGPR